jgi:hypothetical protein
MEDFFNSQKARIMLLLKNAQLSEPIYRVQELANTFLRQGFNSMPEQIDALSQLDFPTFL